MTEEQKKRPLRLMDLRQGEQFRFADDDEIQTVEIVTPIGEWFVKNGRGKTQCLSGHWLVERVEQ